MKILIIHTRYQLHGGEDTVFEQESHLLSKVFSVHKLKFNNLPGYKGALQFITSIWNILVIYKLRKSISTFNPDIIHIHNWHFASGPIIIRIANKMGIPIVLTLHNYRLLCPSATFLHNNSIFTSSIDSDFPWRAVLKKVYRNSRLQTFWLAFVIWFHKKIGTWSFIDRYLVLTDFALSIYSSSSLCLSPQKFVIKPNFVLDPGPINTKRNDYFLFIGRLSDEKGIYVLIHAFQKIGLNLRIAGDGPLKDFVLAAVANNPSNIQYLGILDKVSVQNELSKATALVFPSIWYEGMPMTILEAFASGTPVIASNLGAMASMIQSGFNGLHFEAGNSSALAHELLIWNNFSDSTKASYSQNARFTYESYYTPEKNQEQLLAIYQRVINEKKAS